MSKRGKRGKQYYKVFRQGNGETVIHFNPEKTPIGESELEYEKEAIRSKSDGRILLISEHIKYGILYVRENLLISPGLKTITSQEATKIVTDKIMAASAAR